ncbi:MAG: RluA family pseudouridine synthase [Clostridia bacterium]|nr:RluA family pseudouridine synthase [Clostridia bacterium]
MRELKYTVLPEDDGKKLSQILRSRLKLSNRQISHLKFCEGIWLGDKCVHTGVFVKTGDTVRIEMRDHGPELVPYALPLKILYRDEDVLVVDKPAPLPSIRSVHQDEKTLENAVYAYMGCPEGFVYRPVSRLDKGTSGLMPVALNAHAHDRMQRALHTESYVREYLTVIDGAPEEDAGVIDLPIGMENGVKRCIDPNGKPSVTHFKVLQRAENGRSLLRLRLETGRTHQIRVHMSAMGHPVTGDFMYGREIEQLPGRFALHAACLCFIHPVTGEKMTFESPLPEEIEKLLK